eukprot:2939792-Prymnesium_polylepis.1
MHCSAMDGQVVVLPGSTQSPSLPSLHSVREAAVAFPATARTFCAALELTLVFMSEERTVRQMLSRSSGGAHVPIRLSCSHALSSARAVAAGSSDIDPECWKPLALRVALGRAARAYHESIATGRWPMLSPEAVSGRYARPA